MKHDNWVLDITTDRDNKYIASAGKDKVIKIWDMQSGNLIHNLEGHRGFIKCLEFSSDSRYLYSSSFDTSIIQWDVVNGKCIATFGKSIDPSTIEWKSDSDEDLKSSELDELRHEEWVNCIDLSSDEKYLASGSTDNRVILWDVETAAAIDSKEAEPGDVLSVKFLRNGKYLLSATSDGTIKRYPVIYTPGNRKRESVKLDRKNVKIAHSPYGIVKKILPEPHNANFFVTLSGKNKVHIWDLPTMTVMNEVDVFKEKENKKSANLMTPSEANKVNIINDICIARNGRTLFYGTNHGEIMKSNFPGFCWHFSRQLENLENANLELYNNFLGDNLKWHISVLDEAQDSITQVYKRIFEKYKIDDRGYFMAGQFFSPEFIRLLPIDAQRKYIQGVKNQRDLYWKSLTDLYNTKPSFIWSCNIYFSDENGDPSPSNLHEVDHQGICITRLKDRTQNTLYFKCTIDSLPLIYIPLIKSITCIFENDSGDVQELVFSEFVYNKDNRTIEDWSSLKIDEGYRIKKSASITLKNFNLNYEENLINESDDENGLPPGYLDILTANFQKPVIPPIKMFIGKRLSEFSKMFEVLMPKIVGLEIVQVIVGFSAPLIFPELDNFDFLVYSAIGIIIIILFMQYFISRRNEK